MITFVSLIRSHTEGKIPYKQGTNKKIQKVVLAVQHCNFSLFNLPASYFLLPPTLQATQKDIKGSKEKTADSRSAQGGKYVKPRATNPKPFRLRTDVCQIPTVSNAHI